MFDNFRSGMGRFNDDLVSLFNVSYQIRHLKSMQRHSLPSIEEGSFDSYLERARQLGASAHMILLDDCINAITSNMERDIYRHIEGFYTNQEMVERANKIKKLVHSQVPRPPHECMNTYFKREGKDHEAYDSTSVYSYRGIPRASTQGTLRDFSRGRRSPGTTLRDYVAKR